MITIKEAELKFKELLKQDKYKMYKFQEVCDLSEECALYFLYATDENESVVDTDLFPAIMKKDGSFYEFTAVQPA